MMKLKNQNNNMEVSLVGQNEEQSLLEEIQKDVTRISDSLDNLKNGNILQNTNDIDLGNLSQGTFGDKNENVASTTIVRTELIELDNAKETIYVDLPKGFKYIVYYGDTLNYSETNLLNKLTNSYCEDKQFIVNARYIRIKFAYWNEDGVRQEITPEMLNQSGIRFYTAYFERLNILKNKANTVYVAAYNSSDYQKAYADYICDGENDQIEIQKAVDDVEKMNGGTVRLSNGIFNIDSFAECSDGVYRAITIPSGDRGITVNIVGESQMTNNANSDNTMGTRLFVKKEVLESFDVTKQYEVISALASSSFPSNVLHLKEFQIRLETNQVPCICINLINMGRAGLYNIKCIAYTTAEASLIKAVEKCIGIRMLNGSNNGQENNYVGCGCSGFFEGFQVGSEHVVMINCSAIKNVYGYTFGNYDFSSAFNHSITLINCCDERNVNLPYFNSNTGTQRVNLIDFCVERYRSQTPGKKLGDLAKESKNGMFSGDITFNLMDETATNVSNTSFFAEGSGKNFRVRNTIHALSGTTQLREEYSPNQNQEYYDTDLKALLKYIDGEWINVSESTAKIDNEWELLLDKTLPVQSQDGIILDFEDLELNGEYSELRIITTLWNTAAGKVSLYVNGNDEPTIALLNVLGTNASHLYDFKLSNNDIYPNRSLILEAKRCATGVNASDSTERTFKNMSINDNILNVESINSLKLQCSSGWQNITGRYAMVYGKKK